MSFSPEQIHAAQLLGQMFPDIESRDKFQLLKDFNKKYNKDISDAYDRIHSYAPDELVTLGCARAALSKAVALFLTAMYHGSAVGIGSQATYILTEVLHSTLEHELTLGWDELYSTAKEQVTSGTASPRVQAMFAEKEKELANDKTIMKRQRAGDAAPDGALQCCAHAQSVLSHTGVQRGAAGMTPLKHRTSPK